MSQVYGVTATERNRWANNRSVSANYTFTPGDTIVTVDCSGGARTITLPLCAVGRGRCCVVIREDANTVNALTISRAGADVIGFGAAATVVLGGGGASAQDQKVWLISNGISRWYRLL